MAKVHAVVANGARFSARPGDILLDAALSSGIELPHDCRAGRCGTCLVRLQRGRTFGGESRQEGMIHACQARVFSDLAVEYDVLPAIERIDARVSRVADLTDDVVEVTITPARRMPLLAGQYCRFTFRGFPSRAFSPTAPLHRPARAGRSFRLNVKRVRGGRVSPCFGRLIRVGHPLKVEGPFGSAFLRPGKTQRLVLVAGGTGFAPMWSIAEAALRENPARQVVLVTGARKLDSLYMWPALNRVAVLPNVSVFATVEEQPAHPALRQGRPSDHVPRLTADDVVYAAGAPEMVDGVAEAARDARALFYCDPFEASGQPNERSRWLNVLSWIKAA
jgi:CDP-4-dehydro-6-deoxyglucose reductase, E3